MHEFFAIVFLFRYYPYKNEVKLSKGKSCGGHSIFISCCNVVIGYSAVQDHIILFLCFVNCLIQCTNWYNITKTS